MRHLLNTLFILSPDAYLSLKNENVLIKQKDKLLGQLPLHSLEKILYFGYQGVSPSLIGECAKRSIGLCFLNQQGRFLALVTGANQGNVLLRKEQYRISDNNDKSCQIAKNFIVGKIYNARSVLERARRDHPLSIDIEKFRSVAGDLLDLVRAAKECEQLDILRGVEGVAANKYFGIFDDLILQNKDIFFFNSRNKRPPLDNVNALMSFIYTILANDCASAIASVGLDPYVGFLHRDRPGRVSLALDLMEELRSVYADRFVLTLINNRMLNKSSFSTQENGAVLLSDEARRLVINEWQVKKKDIITHPFLQEKIYWGLVPFVQALLLARFIRGDLEEYPTFLWK